MSYAGKMEKIKLKKWRAFYDPQDILRYYHFLE